MNWSKLVNFIVTLLFSLSLGVGFVYLDYPIWVGFGLIFIFYTIGVLSYEIGLQLRSNNVHIGGAILITAYVLSLTQLSLELAPYFHMLVLSGSSFWLGWTGEYRYRNGLQPFQKYDWWPRNPLLWFLAPYYYFKSKTDV